MLIIALVLALIGLVALVFAVVTSNELVAWVCIGASILGVVLLIIDAVQERQRRGTGAEAHDEHDESSAAEAQDAYDYPEDAADEGQRSSETTTGATEEAPTVADGRGDEPAK
ncbi:MAG: hypothetical protein QOC58_460 [Mycobacterium sp.]|jgi:hypothetical protein|nr:hypothetical protein [Mycobacterium sp.]